MKKHLSLLILLLIIISTISFGQTSYVKVASLNFRSDTTLSSGSIIAQIYKGDSVLIKQKSGKWAYVSYHSKLGYVYYDYLTLKSPQVAEAKYVSPSTKSQPQGTVYICVSPSAYAYHKYMCSGLSRCTHDVIEITVDEAQKRGYVPCKICYK